MWATEQETTERFYAETCDRKPADPGDVRFEFSECGIDPDDGMPNGDDERPYYLEMIDDTGTVIERHHFVSAWERSNMVEGYRYCQAVPFEEEFAPFGPAWQREQMERGGAFA